MPHSIPLILDLRHKPTPLEEAVVKATPWMKFKDKKVILHLSINCSALLERIQEKVENIVQAMLETKTREYIQSIVLSVILQKEIWNHQLQLAGWQNDNSHKFDAILSCRGIQYKIDFTLDITKFWKKIEDNWTQNESDWVVLLCAPESQEFHKYVLQWYSGDFSATSLKDFLESRQGLLESIDWNIKDRRTKKMPDLLSKPLSIDDSSDKWED